ncbi:MAG: HD domain-containing phosphohydrolase [Desulfatirhabdiaceae bacterium]
MELKNAHTLLLVDDEPSILHSLQRLFRKDQYSILTAGSGSEGLDILASEETISMIISDQRMPGMTGTRFLEKARLVAPDAVRILMTGYSDIKEIIEAVNKGQIHRYLTKPWDDGILLLEVRQALESYDLKIENQKLMETVTRQNTELLDLNRTLEIKIEERTRELQEKSKALELINTELKKSLVDTIRLIFSLIETINPRLGSYLSYVAQLSRRLGTLFNLGPVELDNLEIAGLLHDAGLLGLSKSVLQKEDQDRTESERNLYRQHPIIGQICLQPVSRLETVATTILYHHEHFDGTGFPEGLKRDQIPLGSRIIHAVADYAVLLRRWPESIPEIRIMAQRLMGKSLKSFPSGDRNDVVAELTRQTIIHRSWREYDPEVVKKLFELLEEDKPSYSKKKAILTHISVQIRYLKDGMVIAEDIRTIDGRLLLVRGSVLDRTLTPTIQKLYSDGLIGDRIEIRI